jgi:hypothetical protein
VFGSRHLLLFFDVSLEFWKDFKLAFRNFLFGDDISLCYCTVVNFPGLGKSEGTWKDSG